MNILVFCALFFPVVLSGLSIFVFKTGTKNLKLITAFSGAYLLAISFLEILPEIYKSSTNISTIGGFILLGFFIQLLLDFITKGVEHGHQHEGHHHGKSISPLPVIIGLFIHSFLEGMPLSDGFNIPELRNTLLTGIIIHNIPISMVLMSLLLQSKVKNSNAFLFLLVFAFSAPLGTLTSYLVGKEFFVNMDYYFSIVMALVVGIFLHISTTILFETDDNHRFNWLKLFVIILGAFSAFLLIKL
jgi:zinc transporter ZupT